VISLNRFFVYAMSVFSFLLLQNWMLSSFNGVSNAEFILISIFILYFLLGDTVVLNKFDMYFLFVIVWYCLGGVLFDGVDAPGFFYQLKSFAGFFVVFYLSRSIIKTEQDLFFLFKSTLLGVVGLTISVFVNGFNEIGLSSFAGQRDILIASGLTWNGYVGLLSLIFAVALHLFIYNVKFKRDYYIYLVLMLGIIFIVVLSSGRQAISTIAIMALLAIFFYQNGRKRILAGLYFSLFMLFFYSSYVVVSIYFPEFYSFSTDKYDTYIDDLIYVRLYTGFLEPLNSFSFSEMMFFGDPSLNKHNIFTTVLYKFGFVGFVVYFARFFHLTSYIYRFTHASKTQVAYNLKGLYVLTLVSFMLTNFVANIWYQSYLYGYIFWMFIGAIFGVLKSGSKNNT